MAGAGGRRCVNRSGWGVLGEQLEWPQGLRGEKRFPSSGVHGETWLVTNISIHLQQELNATREEHPYHTMQVAAAPLQKRKKAVRCLQAAIPLEKLEKGIQRLQQGIEEAEEVDSLDESSDEGGYTNDYDIADRMNPHDRTDKVALLEERQALKTELEEQLAEVSDQLQQLQGSSIRFTWNRRDLPEQLHRLDRPWEELDRQQLREARRAAEAAEAAARAEAEKRARKKGKSLTASPSPRPPAPETPDTFVVKLYEPAPRYVADGRRINFTSAAKEKADELLHEGESQMQAMWRYIVEKGGFDFEGVHLLPVVHVATVERKHKTFGTVFNAGFFRPYMKNGTIGEVIKKLSGKRTQLFYNDTLLVSNAKAIISCMAFLEHHSLFHGSIHPNNIFVSDDGFRLLIGDFLPRTEFTRWMVDMAHNLAGVPNFFSPEYKQAVSLKRIQKPHFYTEKLSVFKHDMFCFGLVVLFLATMEEPSTTTRLLFGLLSRRITSDWGDTMLQGLNDSSKRCLAAVEALRRKDRDPELVSLLSSALTFDPAERPSWKDLLGTGERLQMQAADFIRGIGNFLGITRRNAEDAYLSDDPAVRTQMQDTAGHHAREQEAGSSGCQMM